MQAHVGRVAGGLSGALWRHALASPSRAAGMLAARAAAAAMQAPQRRSTPAGRLGTTARALSTATPSSPAPPPISRAPGSVFVWGSDANKQLGLGAAAAGLTDGKKSATPVPLATQLPAGVRSVACGTQHTVVATDAGEVFSWGSSDYGALGLRDTGLGDGGKGGSVTSAASPRLVDVLVGQDIVSVAAGAYHSAAVSSEGDVYTWGWGGSFLSGWGGLGHGDKTTQELPGLVERLVDDGHRITGVSCGAKHTLAVSQEGVVLAWGDGEFGRLGNGRSSAPHPEVVEELASVPCQQVAAGESFSMALSREGRVFVWGRNDQSQLGLGANLTMDLNSMEEFPLPCPGLDRAGPVSCIAAGRQHAIAVTAEGEVYHWGARQFIEPRLLTTLQGIRIVHATAGDDCSALLDDEGRLYTFGKRRAGVLGHGKPKTLMQPELVAYFVEHGITLADVQFGHSHAVATVGQPRRSAQAAHE